MTGTSQGLTVITPHAESARCDLVDSKANQYYIKDTPGSATVTKGDGPLVITCKKSGYKTETVTVEESFSGVTLTNLFLLPVVGIVVDAASGAAQEYPSTVEVWMQPSSFKSAADRTEWEAKKAAHDAKLKAAKEVKSAVPNNRRR